MTTIEEVKQKLSIVDVVGQYVSLKKSGRNYKGVCPFHSENTPSFMVSEELGIFKCFGCNQGGDIFKFTQEIEGIDFNEALKKLAERAGVEIKNTGQDPQAAKRKILYEINHLTSEFYYYLLTKHPAGVPGLEYLTVKRKLTLETIKNFKLGFAPNSWDILYQFLYKKKYTAEDMADAGVIVKRANGSGYIDKFRNRVVFPFISVDDKVVGFTGRALGDEKPKYLNTSETLVFHKSSFIYGLDKAKTFIKKEGALMVEGNMDVVTPHQFGIKNTVAVSGTSLTISQLKILYRYSQDITFCFDSDTAGSSATLRAIEMADTEGFNVKIALLPKPFKDIDELSHANLDETHRMIREAIPAFDYYLISALKSNDKRTANGKKRIIELLMPIYAKISSKVVLEHYLKKVSEELDVDISLLHSYVKNGGVIEKEAVIPTKEYGIKPHPFDYHKSPEAYIIALLIKAPIDNIRPFLYGEDRNSLNENDFTDEGLEKLFESLKEYFSGVKRDFDIKYFTSSLGDEKKKLVEDLYLWDLDYAVNDPKILNQELEVTFARLRDLSIKRRRKELTLQIKQAEFEKDDKLVKKLSKEFEDLF